MVLVIIMLLVLVAVIVSKTIDVLLVRIVLLPITAPAALARPRTAASVGNYSGQVAWAGLFAFGPSPFGGSSASFGSSAPSPAATATTTDAASKHPL